MTMRKKIARDLWLVLGLALGALSPGASAQGEDPWAGYLDYAYVYSSADGAALRARLAQYGREAGLSLEEWIARHREPVGEPDETAIRRFAVANLLHYLAAGEPRSLGTAVDAIGELEDRLSRHENRYWFRYILAHRALEKGHAADFVGELLDLWLDVVVPLETPYEALHTLSLSESPNSGFVSALPFLYENVARMILLRSQEMGLDSGLDPLGALVRLLGDGRIGAHPEVIPPEASSAEYLQRIIERLDGPESDGGSLTFTLALFEASKYHDTARSLLASEGLGEATIRAIRIASGAYETALNRADTVQGEAAVYTRVLRQIGEVYAAKQRLGVDPEVETPFSIEGAIRVYEKLRDEPEAWAERGYASTGRQSYVEAMQRLWEEIQETILNGGDYYLTRAVAAPPQADRHARNAARLFARYLSFFLQFATGEGQEGVPDSAYFAAFEAARGVGDAFLAYAQSPSPAEIDLGARRYLTALEVFPFDPTLWSAFTEALGRMGRQNGYLELVRPVAESVTRSRSVQTWIDNREPGAERIATLRRALADGQVLMYLGFAEAAGVGQIEQSLADLRSEREATSARLHELSQRRARLDPRTRGPVPAAPDEGSGAPSTGAEAQPASESPVARARELAELDRRIAEESGRLERIEDQIEARSRALPLFKAALEADGLIDELRAQRDHPVHTLLRRMYYEVRS